MAPRRTRYDIAIATAVTLLGLALLVFALASCTPRFHPYKRPIDTELRKS